MVYRIITLISLFVFFGSCCKKNSPDLASIVDEPIDIQSVAKSILGVKSTIISNENGEYYLCIVQNGALDIRFLVLNSLGEKIYPVRRARGTIKWKNNTQLLLQIDPGHIGRPESQPSAQIIDLEFQKEKM